MHRPQQRPKQEFGLLSVSFVGPPTSRFPDESLRIPGGGLFVGGEDCCHDVVCGATYKPATNLLIGFLAYWGIVRKALMFVSNSKAPNLLQHCDFKKVSSGFLR